MIVLRELASAKINLYLHITGKRPDGYHLLDSLVVFADSGDKLEIIPSDRLGLQVVGPYADFVPSVENSIIRAAEELHKHAGIKTGAALTLHKHLPVAAGIGGGSADAAAALRLLTRFWKINISDHDLNALALRLGADVPACLRSKSLYMGGIGEQIEAGPTLTGLPLVMINPGKPLATKDVFKAYYGGFSEASRHPPVFASHMACTEFLRKTRNDLEAPAISLIPEIKAVLDALACQKDCLLARMSGSGATCFGVFAQGEAAKNAAKILAVQHPKWWIMPAAVQ